MINKGKTTVAIAIAKYAISKNLKVRFSFPAARLIHEFRQAVPEAIFGTARSHFGIKRHGLDEVREPPQDDDLWITDEISRYDRRIIDHICSPRMDARNWPVWLCLGDRKQLGAIGAGQLIYDT